MLQALDCLAWNGIIHRDVKPANILYTLQADGQYQFQLGDFGLCSLAITAASTVGTYLYMAPEMFQKGMQTPKADVWSLFVTMLWTPNIGEFRDRSNQFKSCEDVWEAVSSASNMAPVSKIQEMASLSPDKRASAAQMLVRRYNGEGLSTPRNQVPDFNISPFPAIAAAGSASTTRIRATLKARAKPIVEQKNTNLFALAAQRRGERISPFRRP